MTRLRMKTTDHTHKYQDVVTAGSKIIYRFKKSNWTRTRRKKGKEESTLTVGVNDVKQQVESVSNSSSCNGFPLKVCNSHRYIWPLNVGCFNQSIGSFSRISRRPVIITERKVENWTKFRGKWWKMWVFITQDYQVFSRKLSWASRFW